VTLPLRAKQDFPVLREEIFLLPVFPNAHHTIILPISTIDSLSFESRSLRIKRSEDKPINQPHRPMPEWIDHEKFYSIQSVQEKAV